MHRLLRFGFAWGIWAAFGWPGFAHQRPPKAISEQPLTIRIYNLADAPSRTLNDAMQNASRILAAAGVGATWQQGSAGAPEAHTIDLSRPVAWKSPAYGIRDHITVRILRGGPAGYFPGVLGYALPDARIGVNATIFYDRIERLTEPGVIDLATVLGRVMAHEIGHVLLGSAEHSRTGIMKGSWTKADFQNLASGSAEFTVPQCAAIREHVSMQSQYEQANGVHPKSETEKKGQ